MNKKNKFSTCCRPRCSRRKKSPHSKTQSKEKKEKRTGHSELCFAVYTSGGFPEFCSRFIERRLLQRLLHLSSIFFSFFISQQQQKMWFLYIYTYVNRINMIYRPLQGIIQQDKPKKKVEQWLRRGFFLKNDTSLRDVQTASRTLRAKKRVIGELCPIFPPPHPYKALHDHKKVFSRRLERFLFCEHVGCFRRNFLRAFSRILRREEEKKDLFLPLVPLSHDFANYGADSYVER